MYSIGFKHPPAIAGNLALDGGLPAFGKACGQSNTTNPPATDGRDDLAPTYLPT